MPTRLAHEVLSTLIAEVTAIINTRPLAPISSHAESTFLLTPALLLTQKGCPNLPPPGTIDSTDLHRQQWRQVQYLANTFWSRWKRKYFPRLQSCSKWHYIHPNIKKGDLVLLKDDQVRWNDWPIVRKTFSDQNGKVSRVDLKVTRSLSAKPFLRTVSEIVLPQSAEETD